MGGRVFRWSAKSALPWQDLGTNHNQDHSIIIIFLNVIVVVVVIFVVLVIIIITKSGLLWQDLCTSHNIILKGSRDHGMIKLINIS